MTTKITKIISKFSKINFSKNPKIWITHFIKGGGGGRRSGGGCCPILNFFTLPLRFTAQFVASSSASLNRFKILTAAQSSQFEVREQIVVPVITKFLPSGFSVRNFIERKH